MKTTTEELSKIYSKRISIVKSAWNDLMDVQSTLTIEQINSDEFQSKRKRIGAIYSRLNKIILAPRREAVNRVTSLGLGASAQSGLITEYKF